MRGKIHAMYILNANSLTLRFFRKFFLISPGMYHFQNTGMKIDIIHYGQNRIWLERFMPCHRWRNCSSILAMWRAYGRVGVARAHLIHESTYLMIYNTGLLEAESPRVFRNVYQRYVHHKESAVTLEIRESHLRIISVSRKSDGFNGTNSWSTIHRDSETPKRLPHACSARPSKLFYWMRLMIYTKSPPKQIATSVNLSFPDIGIMMRCSFLHVNAILLYK